MSQVNGLEQYAVQNNEDIIFCNNNVLETVVETTEADDASDSPICEKDSPLRRDSEEEEEEEEDLQRAPDSALFQPQMQSVIPPVSTMIPFTSRSAEAAIFAAQRAWLATLDPNAIRPGDLDHPFGTIVEKSSQISLQASKVQTKTREDGMQPLKCSLCPDWFFSHDKMTIHLISNHGRHHCSYCTEMFDSDEVRLGHEMELHFPLKCDICDARVENLDEHYEEVHDMCNCKFCGVLVKPKSYYPVHVRRKHFVTSVETLEERDVRLVGDWSSQLDAWNFHCHLCGKERKRADIFGHFFSYHRLSLMCLIVFLRTEQVLFNIHGTVAPLSFVDRQHALVDSVTDDSSKTSQNSVVDSMTSTSCDDLSLNICTVCTKPFTFEVPKPAHDIRCRGLVICHYCSQTFSQSLDRDRHVESEHLSFPCVRCERKKTSTCEAELRSHYKAVHGEIMCHYCETFLPNDLMKLSDHVVTNHGVNSTFKPEFNRNQSLSNILVFLGENIFCGLCEADVTLAVTDLQQLCKHLAFHNVSLISTLEFLELLKPTAKQAKTWKPNKRKSIDTSSASLQVIDSDEQIPEKAVRKKMINVNLIAKKVQPKQISLPRKIPNIPAQKLPSPLEGLGRETVIIDGTCKTGEEVVDAAGNGEETNCESSMDSTSDEEEAAPIASSSETDEESDAYLRKWDREMDMTEIECVMNDTSDDEYFSEDEALDYPVKQEQVDSNEDALDLRRFVPRIDKPDYQSIVSRTEKTIELIERTMEDIFQDSPRTDWANPQGDVEVRINDQISERVNDVEEESESKENSDAMNKNNTSYHIASNNKNGLQSEAAMKMYAKGGHRITKRDEVVVIKTDPEAMELLLPTKYKCELCADGKTTMETAEEYVQHMKAWHKLTVSSHAQPRDFSVPEHEAFRCPFCSVTSAYKSSVRQHVFDLHPTQCATEEPAPSLAYGCRYCGDKFWRAAQRNDHQLAAHADRLKEFYKCHVCAQVFSSKLLLTRHAKSSHPDDTAYTVVVYKCRLCLITHPTLDTLRNHFICQHINAMVFPCHLCSVQLKTKKTLRSHIKNSHSARSYDCKLCGKLLASKRAYGVHFRMKHSQVSKVGFRCRICKCRFDTKDDRKMHYTMDHLGESPYHCSECGKGFASKSGMYGHKQLHTGSGISTCQYCGKEFTRKDSYNEHLLIHNGPRHKCPHCPKEFVQRSNLVRHIRIHTGEKPYKCLYCDKCFSDKGACNSHIRVHTREETCSCPYCGQSFSKKQVHNHGVEQKLKYHIRKHTGEGLINCEVCSKSFTNSFALKEHRLIHNRETTILCGTCGKGFNSEKYLQRHVTIVHEPQQTFICPLCTKEFSQQTRLRSHLMTHTGVKHMKCLLCDKAYSVRKSLRRHLLEKHEVAPENPNYKRCFYAMSHQEAGLEIPADMSFFVAYEDRDRATVKMNVKKGGGSAAKTKPKEKGRIAEPSTSKQPKEAEPSTSDDETSSGETESEEERRDVGISHIVDRLQKRLGPGRKKESDVVSRPVKEAAGSSEEEPVLARMAALNGPGKLPAVGRRSLGRKPVPERIPRKHGSGKRPSGDEGDDESS